MIFLHTAHFHPAFLCLQLKGAYLSHHCWLTRQWLYQWCQVTRFCKNMDLIETSATKLFLLENYVWKFTLSTDIVNFFRDLCAICNSARQLGLPGWPIHLLWTGLKSDNLSLVLGSLQKSDWLWFFESTASFLWMQPYLAGPVSVF